MQEAIEHLGGLSKVDKGLDLEASHSLIAKHSINGLLCSSPLLPRVQAQLGVGTAAEPVEDGAVQRADADAQDFADEDELIEDAGPAPAVATKQFAMLGAALQAGTVDEDEDYDFDDEAPAAPAAQASAAPAAAPPAPPLLPATPRVAINPAEQEQHTRKMGLLLPVLGHLPSGEAILSFSSLFQPQLPVHPPTALPRQQQAHDRALALRRALAEQAGLEGVDRGADEDDDRLLHAAEDELAVLGLEPVYYQPPKERQPEVEQAQKEEPPAQVPSAAATVQPPAAAPGQQAARPASVAREARPPSATDLAAASAAPALPSSAAGPQFPQLPDTVYDAFTQQNWEGEIRWARAGSADEELSEHESEEGTQQGGGRPQQQQQQQQHAAVSAGELQLGALPVESAALPWSRAAPSDSADEATDDVDVERIFPHAPLLRAEVRHGEEAGHEAEQLPQLPGQRGALAPAWDGAVEWQGGKAAAAQLRPMHLWLDLNDKGLIFQQTGRLRDGSEVDQLLKRSQATIFPQPPKVRWACHAWGGSLLGFPLGLVSRRCT